MPDNIVSAEAHEQPPAFGDAPAAKGAGKTYRVQCPLCGKSQWLPKCDGDAPCPCGATLRVQAARPA